MSDNPFPDTTFKAHEFTKSDMTEAHFNGVDLSNALFWAVLGVCAAECLLLRTRPDGAHFLYI